MSRTRVLMIGLDGATFDLIEPWVAQGHLPTIGRMLAQGVHSPLQVEIPCNTIPNWPSFMTGVNPAKHGFFDFMQRKRGSYGLEPVHPSQHDRLRFWDVLAEAGYRVGVLNVPATYPPRPLANGVLITGMFTPTEADTYTWPPELKAEILAKYPGFRVNFTEFYPGGVPDLMADLKRVMERRLDVAEYLWSSRDLDFMALVVRGTDRVQHEYFHMIDPQHPRYDAAEVRRHGNPILDYYKALDARLGRMLERVGPEVVVFLMSDHGQMPYRKIFGTEYYLLEHGFVKAKPNLASALKYRLLRWGWSPRTVITMIEALRLKRTVKEARRRRHAQVRTWQDRLFFSHSDIDWSRTLAYCPASGGVYVNVNLQGREPQGCVPPSEYEAVRDRLIAELLAFRDPETGAQVVTAVHRKEEVYHGPFLDAAPDLILETGYGYGHFGGHSISFPGSLSTAFGASGTHSPQGIFVAYGPSIKQGAQAERPRIVDLAPTVLHLFGLAVPRYFDGRVLRGIYEPGSELAGRPVRYDDEAQITGESGQDEQYSREEKEQIEARLRALGYL